MALLYDQFGRELPARQSKPPRARTLYTPSIRDRYYSYPRRGITPIRLSRILREADMGQPARQVELFRDVAEVDAHLSSQLQMRKAAVTGLEFELHPATEDAQAERAAEFCREVVSGLEDWDDLLADLLDAVPQGWAMTELSWDVSSGQVVIAGFRDVPQERTVFDDNGLPRLITEAEPVNGVEWPAWQVVYHRHRSRKAAPVRAGVMRTAVWWWLFKSFSIKDWAVFAEVFGMPLRVGHYPSSLSKDDREAFKQALYDLGTDGVALISEGSSIEFVSSKTTGAGQMVYEKLAEYCDRAQSKAILGQTLTSDVGKVGSLAAARVHDSVRQDLRDDDAKYLAKTIRQQILVPLVLFNFGADCPVPSFRFNIEDPEDLAEKQKVYNGVLDMGLKIPLGHAYQAFGIPEPQDDEAVLSRQPEQGEAQSNRAGALVAEFNRAGDPSPAGTVQAAIDTLGDEAMSQAAQAVKRLTDPLRAAVQSATDHESAQAAVLAAISEMDPEPLAQALFAAAVAAELNGRMAATLDAPLSKQTNRLELNSARFLARPVQPVEAIQFFRSKINLTPEQFAALEGRAKAMAFAVAGVAEEDLLGEIFTGLKRSLRQGTTFDEFRDGVDKLFTRAGFEGPTPYHLETVFRNQIQSAYSGGRYRQMSELAKERPYWQYTAVMDRSTRFSHAAQDGKVYRADDAYWSTWYPPNGHNCRCDVISLSEMEVGEQGLTVESDAPDLMPDPGWEHNVGEAGWGRGLVEGAFDGAAPRGGWQTLGDLARYSSARPPLPEPAPMPVLPEQPERFLRTMSEAEVRKQYEAAAAKTLGMKYSDDGRLIDLPIVDVIGDQAVLAGRMVPHTVGNDQDLGRGRYLGLARQTVTAADEIWLIPGEYPDGKVRFRRRYLKRYDEGSGRSVMVVAEAERRVWDGFNLLPLDDRTANQQRQGLLLYRKQP